MARLARLGLALALYATLSCNIPPDLAFIAPGSGMLTQTGPVTVTLSVPKTADVATLEVRMDGVVVTSQLPAPIAGIPLIGKVDVPAAGIHLAEASIQLMDGGGTQTASVSFETTALNNPNECEILNQAECLLPYPSSRFEGRDPNSPTGVRLRIPASGLPTLVGPALSPAPYNQLDGWSPTPQITMHFPGGVDLVQSNAARLLGNGSPQTPPYVGIRMADARSLDADSPTLLLDADTGEHVLHWMELDARANGNPARQALLMRVGKALEPGHRYIVAIRGLRHPDGSLIQAEPAFAALRDNRLTDIAPIVTRRVRFVPQVLDRLGQLGVPVGDLQLAFDFHVQSESQLTRQMLAMRDTAYAWIASQLAVPGTQLFTVTSTTTNDCTNPTVHIWRRVAGTFQSPLFLTAVPGNTGAPQHSVDANDIPVQNGTMNASFWMSVPCSVLDPGGPALYPLVLGHGLFGRGSDMIDGVPVQVTNALADPNTGVTGTWRYVAGATDWRGLSNQDLFWVAQNVIGLTDNQLNNFPAFPDRLRQGMLNTLVLARLMKLGHFNVNATFQTPDGRGVFPGPGAEEYYYGISLGGIMGTYFAALSPDVEKLHVDVPAIDFNLLLQRSTQFASFEALLTGIGLTDPMKTLLGLGLQHELWVSAEPASVASHVTGLVDPPLSGVPAKKILMSEAWLDKQVSNQASELLARTLGIGNLEGSLMLGFFGIPDVTGPQNSAMQIWSTGAFDLWNPAHQQYTPPLANQIPSNVCDPHGQRPTIRASVQQMLDFLQPGGVITNKCTGACDAAIPFEQPASGLCVPPP